MEIPSGVEGIRATLRMMGNLVAKGKKNIVVRQMAAKLTSKLRQKDWMGEITVLHKFVRDNIRYVRDIRGVETIHSPEQILLQEYGDCDDKSLLLASLLESIGHPTRFVAVGKERNKFCHVLVETKVGDKWLPLETTENVLAGWTPQGVKSRMIYHN